MVSKKKLCLPALGEVLSKFDDFCGERTELGKAAKRELLALQEAVMALRDGLAEADAVKGNAEDSPGLARARAALAKADAL